MNFREQLHSAIDPLHAAFLVRADLDEIRHLVMLRQNRADLTRRSLLRVIRHVTKNSTDAGADVDCRKLALLGQPAG